MQPGIRGVARFKCLVVATMLIALAGCATEVMLTELTPQEIGKAVTVGNLANPQITEASGLAASRLYPEILWAINDGGNDPVLYAVGIDGADLGTFRVEDADNYDWEALASFELQDTAYLLIADVGDNWNQREPSSLYVVEEPDITKIRQAMIRLSASSGAFALPMRMGPATVRQWPWMRSTSVFC